MIEHVEGQLASAERTVGVVVERRDKAALAEGVAARRCEGLVKDKEADLTLGLLLDFGPKCFHDLRNVSVKVWGRSRLRRGIEILEGKGCKSDVG